MYISSRLKAVILVFLLTVGGGGAFVFIDPLELDLLGMLGLSPAAEAPVAPKMQPRAALPKGGVPAMAPASTTTTLQTPAKTPDVVLQTAPVVPVSQDTMAIPLEMPAQTIQTATLPASSSNLTAAILPASPGVMKEVQIVQPPLKISKSLQVEKSKFVYPPSIDLRHCLDQPSPQEIAKCAGE